MHLWSTSQCHTFCETASWIPRTARPVFDPLRCYEIENRGHHGFHCRRRIATSETSLHCVFSLPERLKCWHRRILKGSRHEIELLTPVVQPRLVLPWAMRSKEDKVEATIYRRDVQKNRSARTISAWISPGDFTAIHNNSEPLIPIIVGRETAIHIVSPSPTRVVLVPSTLADDRRYCRNQINRSRGRKPAWPGTIRNRDLPKPQTSSHSFRPDQAISFLAERRALPPGENVVVEVKLWC